MESRWPQFKAALPLAGQRQALWLYFNSMSVAGLGMGFSLNSKWGPTWLQTSSQGVQATRACPAAAAPPAVRTSLRAALRSATARRWLATLASCGSARRRKHLHRKLGWWYR